MKTKKYLVDCEKLKALIKSRGLSVPEFASLMGIDASTAYAWIKDDRVMTRTKFEHICRQFNTAKNSLLKDESIPVDGSDYFRQKFLDRNPEVKSALFKLIDAVRNAEISQNTLLLGLEAHS